MKKLPLILVLILAVALVIPTNVSAGRWERHKNQCMRISSGTIEDEFGYTITHGFNQFGINYQSRLAKKEAEEFCHLAVERVKDNPNPPYTTVSQCLEVLETSIEKPIKYWDKWNQAWLSTLDCGTQKSNGEYTELDVPDGKLDRHYGFDSYHGSGARNIGFYIDTYQGEEGEHCVSKLLMIVQAVPANATHDSTKWYVDNVEFGLAGYETSEGYEGLAIVLRTLDDPCGGSLVENYISPYLKNKLNRWRID